MRGEEGYDSSGSCSAFLSPRTPVMVSLRLDVIEDAGLRHDSSRRMAGIDDRSRARQSPEAASVAVVQSAGSRSPPSRPRGRNRSSQLGPGSAPWPQQWLGKVMDRRLSKGRRTGRQ